MLQLCHVRPSAGAQKRGGKINTRGAMIMVFQKLVEIEVEAETDQRSQSDARKGRSGKSVSYIQGENECAHCDGWN
jgi:hypothetical protein